MMPVLKPILDFFKAENTAYLHHNRTIEIIMLEKDTDINAIKEDTKVIMENEGSVEAIVKLRKKFYLTTAAVWRFVDKLILN